MIPHWEWYFEGLALHFDDQPVVFRFWVFSFFFFKYRWILLGRGFPLRRPRGSSSQQRALMCRETDWTQTPIGEIHVGGDSAASTHPYHRLRRRIRDSIGTASPSPSCRWWRAWASSWPCGRPKKKHQKEFRYSIAGCRNNRTVSDLWFPFRCSLTRARKNQNHVHSVLTQLFHTHSVALMWGITSILVKLVKLINVPCG